MDPAPLDHDHAFGQHARNPEATGFADIHCHCLPGLDDGPATMAEALALCRALAEDGIGVVVACAHQLGRYEGRNTPGRIREAVAMLKDALHTEGISLKVLPGADVRLDERIPDLLTRDLVNTVADGGRYLLLELQEGIFIDVLPLVKQLSDRGVRTIITHPERNPCLINSHQQVMRWVAHGALLQLTAGSILGDFGPAAEAAARHWLGTRAAQLVATDAHGVRYRPPRLSKAADWITTSFGFVGMHLTQPPTTCRILLLEGYVHKREVQRDQAPGEHLLPKVHLTVSLLKRWILGTHQGSVGHDHLDYYLDEFTFRFNRRKSASRGKLFYRLAQQAVQIQPHPFDTLIGPQDMGGG